MEIGGKLSAPNFRVFQHYRPEVTSGTKGREGAIRCALHRGPLSGQTGLMHSRLLLTQHFFAVAAVFMLRLNRAGRLKGHGNARDLNTPDHPSNDPDASANLAVVQRTVAHGFGRQAQLFECFNEF